MKKLFFALACVVGLMTFASCTQEVIDDIMAQKPVVEFVAEDGFISGSTGVYVGTELNFKVKVAPNSGSESELVNFDFSITDATGVTVFNQKPEFTDPNAENIFTFSYTPEVASTYAVTATVTDKASKVNVVNVVVDVAQPVVAEMGIFNGLMSIAGHITSNEIAGHNAYNTDDTISNLPVMIALGTLEEDNRVKATIEIDGTPVSLYGTLGEDNVTITFDEFHFRKTINLFIDVNVDFVMNMTAVLNDDTMTLNGTAVGTGKAMVLIAMLEVNYDGVVEGTLQKAPTLD